MFGKSISLRWRLVLIVGLLPLLILTPALYFTGGRFRDFYLTSELEKARIVTRQVERTVSETVPYVDSIQDMVGLERYLRSAIENQPAISFAALVLGDGLVLYHTEPGKNRTVDESLANLEEALDEGYVIREVPPFGRTYLMVESMSLPGSQERLMYAVVGERAAVVEPPFLVLAPALISGVVTLLLVVLMIIFVGRMVVQPVRALAEGAAMIGAGDLGYRIQIDRRDEMGFLARAFNETAERLQELVKTLEQQVAERTAQLEKRGQQLEAVALVSREATTVREVAPLLETSVNAISEHFDYYHAGIFLLDDDREWAVLQAASSEGGRRMLARRHRLRVGHQGIVGTVAVTGFPRIALDVGSDAVWFNTPELPDTHSEIALPLFDADEEVIGVLDVQSKVEAAFSDQDIDTLQLLADQVSIALQNARLIERTRSALSELELLQREQSHTGWARVIRRMRPQAYEYDRVAVNPVLPLPVTNDVLSRDEPTQVEKSDRRTTLMEPLRYRDETLAVLTLSDEERVWTDNERALIQDVSDQIAIALENARLFEDAQRTARNQALLNAVLQTASKTTNSAEALREIARILARGLDMAVGVFTFLRSDVGEVDPQAMILPSGEDVLGERESFTLSPDLQIFFQGLSRPEMGKRLPLFEDLELGGEYALDRVLYVGIYTAAAQIGFMTLIQRQSNLLLDPENRELAQSLANQVAVVVENINLLAETQRRSAELETLYDLSLRFGEEVEAEAIQQLFIDQSVILLEGDAGLYLSYDQRAQRLNVEASVGPVDPEHWESEPGVGFAGLIFDQVQPLRLDDYAHWESLHTEIDAPIRAVLGVPLSAGGEVDGVLVVYRQEQDVPFEPSDVRLAELLVAQAAVAMENARLFEEARIRAEELTQLNELAQALTSRLTVEDVLQQTYEGAKRLLDLPNFYIALYDREENLVTFPLVREKDEVVRWGSRAAGRGLTEYIIRHNEGIVFGNVEKELQQYTDEVESIGSEAHSWIGVPLAVGNEVLGVIAAQSYETPYLYDDHDLNVLSAIAGQTAISLRSARLYEQAQERARQERQIYEITSRLRRSPDVTTILQTAVDELGQALQADRAVIRLTRDKQEGDDGHAS